jgi:hypothetical protein
MNIDVASDMAGDVAADMAGEVRLTAQFWMGPIHSGPNFNPTLIIS